MHVSIVTKGEIFLIHKPSMAPTRDSPLFWPVATPGGHTQQLLFDVKLDHGLTRYLVGKSSMIRRKHGIGRRVDEWIGQICTSAGR